MNGIVHARRAPPRLHVLTFDCHLQRKLKTSASYNNCVGSMDGAKASAVLCLSATIPCVAAECIGYLIVPVLIQSINP
jgi:hypothetical protein